MQRQYHHNITLKPSKKKGTQGRNTFTTNQNSVLSEFLQQFIISVTAYNSTVTVKCFQRGKK